MTAFKPGDRVLTSTDDEMDGLTGTVVSFNPPYDVMVNLDQKPEDGLWAFVPAELTVIPQVTGLVEAKFDQQISEWEEAAIQPHPDYHRGYIAGRVDAARHLKQIILDILPRGL